MREGGSRTGTGSLGAWNIGLPAQHPGHPNPSRIPRTRELRVSVKAGDAARPWKRGPKTESRSPCTRLQRLWQAPATGEPRRGGGLCAPRLEHAAASSPARKLGLLRAGPTKLSPAKHVSGGATYQDTPHLQSQPRSSGGNGNASEDPLRSPAWQRSPASERSFGERSRGGPPGVHVTCSCPACDARGYVERDANALRREEAHPSDRRGRFHRVAHVPLPAGGGLRGRGKLRLPLWGASEARA